MERIDEQSRRKPGFTDGRPAELADGQEWTFALPRLRLSPAREGDTDRYRVRLGRAGVPRYQKWHEVITGAVLTPVEEYWDTRMDAAACLLRANYELSDDELDELLAYEDDGPQGPYTTRWREIDQAILGILPKAPSATSS
jgi:hypothetical protein